MGTNDDVVKLDKIKHQFIISLRLLFSLLFTLYTGCTCPDPNPVPYRHSQCVGVGLCFCSSVAFNFLDEPCGLVSEDSFASFQVFVSRHVCC